MLNVYMKEEYFGRRALREGRESCGGGLGEREGNGDVAEGEGTVGCWRGGGLRGRGEQGGWEGCVGDWVQSGCGNASIVWTADGGVLSGGRGLSGGASVEAWKGDLVEENGEELVEEWMEYQSQNKVKKKKCILITYPNPFSEPISIPVVASH